MRRLKQLCHVQWLTAHIELWGQVLVVEVDPTTALLRDSAADLSTSADHVAARDHATLIHSNEGILVNLAFSFPGRDP